MRIFRVLLLVLLLGACAEPPVPLPVRVGAPIGVAQVLAAVRQAATVRQLPADVQPSLATAGDDVGFDSNKCEAGPLATRIVAPCVFGDRASAYQIMLYGDSQAGMWVPALAEIAQRRHWRVAFYGKPGCPAPDISFARQRNLTECNEFRASVIAQAVTERPNIIIVTSGSFGLPVTSARWQAGLVSTLSGLRRSGARVAVLGEDPVLDQGTPGCLATHKPDISVCATSRAAATAREWNTADQTAATATGSSYIDILPWLCGSVCSPVISKVIVYRNRFRLTATYARTLSGALESALPKMPEQDDRAG